MAMEEGRNSKLRFLKMWWHVILFYVSDSFFQNTYQKSSMYEFNILLSLKNILIKGNVIFF